MFLDSAAARGQNFGPCFVCVVNYSVDVLFTSKYVLFLVQSYAFSTFPVIVHADVGIGEVVFISFSVYA